MMSVLDCPESHLRADTKPPVGTAEVHQLILSFPPQVFQNLHFFCCFLEHELWQNGSNVLIYFPVIFSLF